MNGELRPQVRGAASERSELVDAVRRLPAKPWFNVVWRKGAVTPGGQEHRGKSPYGGPYKRRTPEECANLLLRRPQDFGAVCVALGPDTGLACLDIDTPEGFRDLANTHGFAREQPYVISRKPASTCFKAFFRVDEVDSDGLHEIDAGAYQLLWHGNIAVILGEYPGSSCGTYAPGVYRLVGDFTEAPEAPLWMLEEMRGRVVKESSFSRALSRVFASYVENQSDEEAAEFIRRQLQYIPPAGTLPQNFGSDSPEQSEGGRKFWLTVGMAIHHRLPDEVGQGLWREWSKRDPDYEAEWASGQAEAYLKQQWATFRGDGGRHGRPVTPGTLFWLAEQHDPQRRRFPEAQRQAIEEVVQKAKQDAAAMRHAELIAALQTIHEQHAENASLITFKLQEIAREYGRTVVEVMGIWAAHKQATLKERTGVQSVADLCSLPSREFLLPGLMQKGAVYVLAGAGGAGKTSFCGALARHVLTGRSIEVKGKQRPVAKGRVMWLSSDTNDIDFRDVLVNAGLMDASEDGTYRYLAGDHTDLDYRPGFQWTMIAALERWIAKHKPDLVVIDSLASCNRTTGIDENSAAVANPIYDLQQLVLDRPVTFVVLHHLNKGGALRGSTAIEAACSSVWRMTRPSEEQCANNNLDVATDRIISPGSKNRGVDQKLLCRLDRTRDIFTIIEFYERDARAGRTCFDRVVNLLDTSGPHSIASLCDLIGSEFSRKAIEKALLRAREAGLIRRTKVQGRARYVYEAVLGGEREKVGVSKEIPVVDSDLIPTRKVGSRDVAVSSTSLPPTPLSRDEIPVPDCDLLAHPYSEAPYARGHAGEGDATG